MTNWEAMQVPALTVPGGAQTFNRPGDVRTRYLSMGSWHADGSKGGKSRKPYKTKEKGNTPAVPTKGKK
jgi:hypothetical protein